MTPRCPKCSGATITEMIPAEGDWYEETRCILCGERIWPDSLRWSRAINRSIYRAREFKRYRSFESAHRGGKVKGFMGKNKA